MVSLQKSEKRKNYSYQVKIILTTSEIHSKASINYCKKSENHSKRVKTTFGGAHGRKAQNKRTVPLWDSKKSKINSFGGVFRSFWSEFYSLWNDFYSFWEWLLPG